MCGIFAYLGARATPEFLLEGLKKLEYRGYDSSGIAFLGAEGIERCRAFGGVAELAAEVGTIEVEGRLGIGHTRWATHGPPSQRNAHPHVAGKIHLVHNGLIENYQELAAKVGEDRLASDTDSEVIAHLIDAAYASNGGDLLLACREVVAELKGSYAVVALSEDAGDELVCFKQGPPLVICKDEQGYCVTSDPHACAELSDQMAFLEDGEIVRLKGDGISFHDFDGNAVAREFETTSYEGHAFDKDGFEDFTLKEIFEQVGSIEHTVASYVNRESGAVDMNVADGEGFDRLFGKSDSLMIVACGSSYYAALYGKYVIESVAPIRVDVEIASELIYRDSYLQDGAPALFISQSGETADTLAAATKAKEAGMEVISLCNVRGSALDRLADHQLYIGAGKEVGVASTKAFSSTLLALQLLGIYVANLKKGGRGERIGAAGFFALPGQVRGILERQEFFVELAAKMKGFDGFFYLGRGPYYPIALEGSLKLKELAYLHSDAHPAGEMKHGPLAMIDDTIMVIVLLPKDGVLYEKTKANLIEAKTRGACMLAIGGPEGDEQNIRSLCDHHFPLPEVDAAHHPILTLLAMQLIAYHVAKECGRDVDKPRNLAKSVTVE